MKIKISYTLEVDPQEWADEYRIDKSEVRDDVKTYFTDSYQIPQHLEGFVKMV